MRGKPMEAHLERQTKGQESQPLVQDELGGAKTHDDGHPLVQVNGRTAQGTSTAQVIAMCRNVKLGTVMGTQAGAVSTIAWFFCERRVPQTGARVEQVSEWVTVWRGFNVDTRRRTREVWRKIASTLAKNPRRWNKATRPISATCHFLTALCSPWRRSSTVFFLRDMRMCCEKKKRWIENSWMVKQHQLVPNKLFKFSTNSFIFSCPRTDCTVCDKKITIGAKR